MTNFQYEVKDSNRVRFTWDFPESYTPHSQTISWSNCEYYDGIGTSLANWPCAHFFDTNDLQDYIGWRIIAVGFIPSHKYATYSIMIWKGEEQPELIYDDPVGGDTLLYQMNYYSISDNIYIEENKQLWVGFNVYALGGYPYACDQGPAVAGKGDLLWWDDEGFVSIANHFGLNYNFCIGAIVESPEGVQKNIGWETESTGNDYITGYNVFLNGQLYETINGEIPLSFDYNCIEDWDFDIAVTAVYGEQESEPVSVHLPWPDDDRWYWKVISQPDGYQEDENGDITISTAEGLAWLISVVNGFNCHPRGNSLGGKTIRITNDLDLSGGLWTSLAETIYGSFTPTIEGNGFTISGLHGDLGFTFNFGGTLKDLSFTDCSFSSNSGNYNYVGCISRQTGGAQIYNCHVQNSTLSSTNSCGGLVGSAASSTFRNCSFTDGTVTSLGSHGGGLVGQGEYVNMENSYFVGSLMNPQGNSSVLGGIVGETISKKCHINNCYSVLMASDIPENVSGIVGVNKEESTITNCYSLSPQEICLNNMGAIENSSMFDGGGNNWHLLEPVMVGGLETDDLLTALDHWVTDQTVPDTYFRWTEDTEMANHGFPVFSEMYDAIEETPFNMDEFDHADIFDITGRLIKRSQQAAIDLQGQPNGLYIIKLTDNNGFTQVRKIIKQ